MEALSPFPTLEVLDPDGPPYQTLALQEDRLTIGRFALSNDLALEPDPQQLISPDRKPEGYCKALFLLFPSPALPIGSSCSPRWLIRATG